MPLHARDSLTNSPYPFDHRPGKGGSNFAFLGRDSLPCDDRAIQAKPFLNRLHAKGRANNQILLNLTVRRRRRSRQVRRRSLQVGTIFLGGTFLTSVLSTTFL